jgi:hypothetical protein
MSRYQPSASSAGHERRRFLPAAPVDCQQGTTDGQSIGAAPEESSELRDGEYRVEITTDDVAAAGLDNEPGWTGTWTLAVKDVTNETSCRLPSARCLPSGDRWPCCQHHRRRCVCLHAVCAGAARPGNRPHSALVVVQTIDGDMRRDGTDGAHVPEFGVALRDALPVVTTASPDSRIIVVGQLGRPSPSFVKKLVAEDPTVKEGLTGSGMCDFFGPDGALNKKAFDTLTSIIEDYETEQALVCATVPNCRTDEGARAAYADRLENFSSDWNHLNVRGEAEVAEITWPAVAALLELS